MNIVIIKIITYVTALSAAYFGGVGIVHLLGQDMLLVAVVIESVKLGINITISAYWHKLTFALRVSGLALLLAGVLFSSLSTYSLLLDKLTGLGVGKAASLTQAQSLKDQLQEDKDAVDKLDAQVVKTPGYDVAEVIKGQRAERARLTAEIGAVQAKIGAAQVQAVQAHVSSVEVLAQAWGVDPTLVSRWALLAITCLFDPAVFFLVSATAIMQAKPQKRKRAAAKRKSRKITLSKPGRISPAAISLIGGQ